ncbi:MAG TPA: acyl-CoA dehydrogenase family protein, partial [Terricaulis sp.]|nr:acyl-CoA dehydrogenase family protein [Terricaulis sp.]
MEASAEAASAYAEAARAAVKARVGADRAAIDREQHLVHGLAWVATYAETLREVRDWAKALRSAGKLGETECLLAKLLVGEYMAQLAGGLPMTQVETIRPADFGVSAPPVTIAATQEEKARLAVLLREARGRATLEQTGLDDDFEMIRDQFRKFADAEVAPHAHDWHLNDELIPLEILQHMGELGVFGLTIPEEFGGSGLGKTAMCVVSEELSRGYIGVGSLGTRSEIAAELILTGGTPEQKAYWLPKIASAEILPTAVFTEPNTGSDLGSLRTRAVREGGDYIVTGNKTWITHAARADVMTLLVRTDPDTNNFSGLSMLLAEKPRGEGENPFPVDGMSGGEIEVLGYRGMKEYEIGFDGFRVKAAN